MTSKSKQLEDSEPKVDYVELLLSHYTRAGEVIERQKSFNLKNGLPEELMEAYINYTVPSGKEKYLNWIDAVTSEHGRFWDMKTLKAASFVSDEETPLDSNSYPRRELMSISRLKTSAGKEVLTHQETWRGLQQDGTEKSLFVPDLDFWYEPHISYVYADPGTTYSSFNPRSTESRKTVSIGQGAKIRVAKLATDVIFPKNEMGTVVYTTEYSPENVYEILKAAPPKGPFGDSNGTALSLRKENASISYSVFTLEEFLSESFDDTYKRLSQPSANINVKDLVDQLKTTRASDLEKVQQYQ
jgi:hypothetical protein